MRNTYTQYRRADKQFACHGTHKGGCVDDKAEFDTAAAAAAPKTSKNLSESSLAKGVATQPEHVG